MYVFNKTVSAHEYQIRWLCFHFWSQEEIWGTSSAGIVIRESIRSRPLCFLKWYPAIYCAWEWVSESHARNRRTSLAWRATELPLLKRVRFPCASNSRRVCRRLRWFAMVCSSPGSNKKRRHTIHQLQFYLQIFSKKSIRLSSQYISEMAPTPFEGLWAICPRAW